VGGVQEDDRKTAEFNYTGVQMEKLRALLDELRARYPHAVVIGHRDLPNVRKACPCFEVLPWYYGQTEENENDADEDSA
jgi:N-acetylmuramoyl-L-alanine amidase